MAEQGGGRPRARSDLSPMSRPPRRSSPQPRNSMERPPDERRPEAQTHNFSSPRRAATTMSSDDHLRPQRTSTALSHFPTFDLEHTESNLRRRPTARSGLTRQVSTAARSRFTTLAGPEDTSQLRTAHEPFVQAGYAELNPSYEQPANTKPLWSLAKPLPRVVRPGMVPTASEIYDSRVRPQLPGENSQNAGVDVDPNDLEQGKVHFTTNPRKLSAQLQDARAQRENNFINNMQRRRTMSKLSNTHGLSLVGTRSSQPSRRRRSSTTAMRPPDTHQWEDVEDHDDHDEKDKEDRPARTSHDSTAQRHNQEKQELDMPGHEPSHQRPSLETIPEGRETRPQSDVSSIATLHDDDIPEVWEDMKPLMQELVEEEVHNNHTAWSVVRTQHREFLAELLAVFIQLTIGFCSDLSVTVAQAGNPNTTDWAWGLATMIGIYISGGISGAHLNPTITTMLWWFRGFPKRKMPEYFLAQLLGAFIAALTAYGLYFASINHYLDTNTDLRADIVNSFVTSQRYTYVDAATAFFNEFIGTAFLAATVLALGDDQNAPPGAGMNAFIIGLVITVLSFAFANQTGAALNPSRDLGPRLALLALGYGKELFTNPYWFYGPWAGTLTGAFVGASLYDVAIFTGGESPINYPLARTKRAMKKSKKKWARRLRLKRKEDDGPWADETRATQ